MNHLKLVFVSPEIPNFPYFYEKEVTFKVHQMKTDYSI